MRRPGSGGEALSVVERGWAGARQCSLELSRRGIGVTHLIKGRLSREELAMITPVPRVQVRSVGRIWFRLALWAVAGWMAARGRLGWCLVDHERTARELAGVGRWLGIGIVQVRDRDDGYELLVNGRPSSVEDVFQ